MTTEANRQLCADWIEWMKAHGRTALTCYQYGAKLDELLTFLGDTPLERATLDQLEAWIARPRKGRGRGQLGSDATRNKDVIVVRGLWKWATAHGRLLLNPTVDLELPTVRNENPRPIPVAVWSRFYSSPVVTDVERVVYGLGFYCGLRRDEVCHLEAAHVDMAAGVIAGFKRKGDRNGKRTGKIPVVSCARLFAEKQPELLRQAGDFLDPLDALVRKRSSQNEAAAREGRTFLIPWGEEAETKPAAWRGAGRPVTPRGMTCPDQINGRLLRALRRAGMADRAFTPHALRHSFVTYLLRADVPIQVVSRLANHSSLDITMRYLKIAEDPLADLIEQQPLKGSRW